MSKKRRPAAGGRTVRPLVRLGGIKYARFMVEEADVRLRRYQDPGCVAWRLIEAAAALLESRKCNAGDRCAARSAMEQYLLPRLSNDTAHRQDRSASGGPVR
jgi:hypothetical protein